jgi:photosystem II stability/assembly factor-like uncharacterized protein
MAVSTSTAPIGSASITTTPSIAMQPKTRLVAAKASLAPGQWAADIADMKMLTDLTGWAAGFTCPGCQTPLDITTDGGESWHRMPSPVGAAGTDAVFALSVGRGPQLWLWSRAYTNSLGSRLFRSLDGGRSWSEVVGLGGIFALAVEPSGVWAIEESCPLTGTVTNCTERLVTTEDGGATWQAPSAQPSVPVGADSVELVRIDDRHAWVLGSRFAAGFVLAATDDGGSSWMTDSTPPQSCAGVPFDLAAADVTHLWLGCGGNGATIQERREVATSDDGGQTWTVTQDAIVSGHLADLTAATPTTGFIGQCRGPLLESRDHGRTWAAAAPNAPLDGCVNPVEFLDPMHGWAGGQSATGAWGIWRTSDGGVTWAYATLI